MNRICSVIVATLLAISVIGQPSASANSFREKETRLAEKVKAAIAQLGTGQASVVNLRLRDKTKLTGYVSEIKDNSFVVTDLRSSELTTVFYPSAVQLKGNNLSTRTKIIINRYF